MEHLGEEAHLRGLVGVVLGELEDELEGPSLPGGIVRAEDDGLPHHDVVVHGGARDAAGRVVLEPAREGDVMGWGRGEEGKFL